MVLAEIDQYEIEEDMATSFGQYRNLDRRVFPDTVTRSQAETLSIGLPGLVWWLGRPTLASFIYEIVCGPQERF